MPLPSPTEPLGTWNFLPIRIGEALSFLGGELTNKEYPPWVQKVGADLAHQLLPAAWVESAKQQRRTFVEGFAVGFTVSTIPASLTSDVPADELAHLQRLAATGVHPEGRPFDIGKGLKLLASKRCVRETKKAVGVALSESPAKRLAFFRGLMLGLDALEEIERALTSLEKKLERDTASLRLFMWLRWIEFLELESIPEAYAKCVKSFARIGRAHVVGTEESFRRFCNRIGLTYRSHQHAQRNRNTKHQPSVTDDGNNRRHPWKNQPTRIRT